MKTIMMIVSLCVALAVSAGAVQSQELPFSPGDYWEVHGIEVESGHGLAYAQFLATTWKNQQAFAKSKGWIKDYHVLANIYARDGEPDLYLVTIMAEMPSNADLEKRSAEYLAWAQASQAELEAEAAGRASIRREAGSILLQAMVFK